MRKKEKYLSADERRAETVQTVVDLAGEKNPSDITTSAIAERMGLTQGALFRHFPTKEAILKSVMEWVSERLISRIQVAAAENPSPKAALRAMFHSHIEFVSQHPGMPRLLFGELQRTGPTGPKVVVQTLMGHYRKLLGVVIQNGKTCGDLASDLNEDAAASLFLGTIQGLVFQSLLAPDPDWILRNADAVYHVFECGIERRVP
ncbi:TetR family transcriptional regulator [candidate division BRC1 bacterium HGW-BRC1-1]|jgi:AcrR family transcriptional regulator|nr:MAG: TetR family transcriptional regulator [candidate division BRC1 bacterium HGW-BRC1-1]